MRKKKKDEGEWRWARMNVGWVLLYVVRVRVVHVGCHRSGWSRLPDQTPLFPHTPRPLPSHSRSVNHPTLSPLASSSRILLSHPPLPTLAHKGPLPSPPRRNPDRLPPDAAVPKRADDAAPSPPRAAIGDSALAAVAGGSSTRGE